MREINHPQWAILSYFRIAPVPYFAVIHGSRAWDDRPPFVPQKIK